MTLNEDRSFSRVVLPGISKADLHIHTNLSDGKPTVEEVVDFVHAKTDLAVIAITDHDTVEGGYEARRLVEKKGYKFEVVIGEEVSALEGHILALYIKEKVPPGLSAKETVRKIHEQGGLAIAAHPFYHTRFKSPHYISMDGVGAVTLIREKFDGVEIVNATPSLAAENLKAKYINRTILFKAELGDSDAHILDAIAMGFTLFDGKTAEDLRQAIITEQTQAYYRNWKWNVLGLFRYAYFFLPKTARNGIYILRHGLAPKEPDIVSIPKDYK